jgi:DNA helicase-2/ATP-dependent DNA helicase PcrA
MDPLTELNTPQQQAVAAGPGQVLVLAGPGSGKTRVLTFRIAYLIYTLGVPPYRINALTFTNKAAREMSARVEDLLGTTAEGLWIGTFHSICARILRREAENLPFSANYVIYDADDQVSLIKNVLRELNIDEKTNSPHGIHAAISNAKNHLIQPKDYVQQTYRDAIAQRVYERYQQILTASDALDFDDLLMWTERLFSEKPQVRQKYAKRFEHVLVDEFQDTNQAQYEIIKHLSAYHHNLFVVGDEDQSIYRWRGADYHNVQRFEQDFPECEKILLEQNYRSPQIVLDAARAVIDQNRNRTPKHLFTERGTGEQIVLYEAPDDFSEAAYVVETIQNGIARGVSGGEYAVMYRTNAQSRLLEEAFMRVGMPYRLVGAQRFYGRREIKDMIAYLRLVHNPTDEVSLARIINVPTRKIGSKTENHLKKTASQAGISPGLLLLDLGRHLEQSPFWEQFSGRETAALAGFGQMFYNWRGAANQMALPHLVERILEDTAYRDYLEDGSQEGVDRWANVEEFLRLAQEFEERGLGLPEFLENLALVSDQDTLPDKLDAPTLLTLHAAKGLEFGQVFIIGLDEGLLPHNRSINSDDPEEMAEERRLFYVGITRTRKQLFFVRAARRSTYGAPSYSTPSRFLDDVPEDLVRFQGIRSVPVSRNRWRQDRYEMQTRWEPQPQKRSSAPILTPKYHANMQVSHPDWGEGYVLESRLDADDEIVDVEFESVGFKRLLASLAHLKILDEK